MPSPVFQASYATRVALLLLLASPCQAELRADLAVSIAEYVSAGTLSSSGAGIPKKNTRVLVAHAVLGSKIEFEGASFTPGLFAETRFGEQFGAIDSLGARSSQLEEEQYGLTSVIQLDAWHVLGTVILLGNYNLAASTSDSRLRSGSDTLKFENPLGLRLMLGHQITHALSLAITYSHTAFRGYAYQDPTTKTERKVEIPGAPLVVTEFGIGLTVIY